MGQEPGQVEGDGGQGEFDVYFFQSPQAKASHSALFFERSPNRFHQSFASAIDCLSGRPSQLLPHAPLRFAQPHAWATLPRVQLPRQIQSGRYTSNPRASNSSIFSSEKNPASAKIFSAFVPLCRSASSTSGIRLWLSAAFCVTRWPTIR
jgi:hypothetical protein